MINCSPDHDDEFVSESYQASTEDINEANASMKRLGVTGMHTGWLLYGGPKITKAKQPFCWWFFFFKFRILLERT